MQRRLQKSESKGYGVASSVIKLRGGNSCSMVLLIAKGSV